MRKTTILFNPNSGRGRKRRDRELDIAIGIIQSAGVHTELTSAAPATKPPSMRVTPSPRAATPSLPAEAMAPSTM